LDGEEAIFPHLNPLRHVAHRRILCKQNVTIIRKLSLDIFTLFTLLKKGGAFDSAKSHKRQHRKRQSVTDKRAKSQTPKFV